MRKSDVWVMCDDIHTLLAAGLAARGLLGAGAALGLLSGSVLTGFTAAAIVCVCVCVHVCVCV